MTRPDQLKFAILLTQLNPTRPDWLVDPTHDQLWIKLTLSSRKYTISYNISSWRKECRTVAQPRQVCRVLKYAFCGVIFVLVNLDGTVCKQDMQQLYLHSCKLYLSDIYTKGDFG